jgi:lipoic acid synthetase
MGLSFVVLTMVTRDDLADGGAFHIIATMKAVRRQCPRTGIELLISDLRGSTEGLFQILEMQPEVLNHNIETVPRLYTLIRPGADYQRSLKLIEQAGRFEPRPVTKSGLMLGLGETREEVLEAMADLRKADCDIITIGQYLAPSRNHHPVVSYLPPEKFESLKKIAQDMGFKGVVSGPFIRSSYRAEELYRTVSEGGNPEKTALETLDARLRGHDGGCLENTSTHQAIKTFF